MRQAYSARSVIAYQHRDEIDKSLCEQGFPRGLQDYLGGYQREVTNIIKDLSATEIEDAQEEAKKWTKRAPPPEVQARYYFRP